jgi:uncharacterized membrane protein YkvI
MSNLPTAPKLDRPTMMYLGVSLVIMSGFSIAISNTCKQNRKGGKYGMVVTGLIISIISVLYNGYLIAMEKGARQFINAQRAKFGAAAVAKVSAPITNVGTGAVAAA